MSDYSHHYAALGVGPETDWKALRTRYRQLIKQWHPDRFSSETDGRKHAEERAKEITLAYQALQRYRREYGVLPPLSRDRPSALPPASGREAGTDFSQAAGAPRRTRPGEPGSQTGVPAKRGATRLVRALLAVAALGALVYFMSERFRGTPRPDDLEVAERAPAPQSPSPPTLERRAPERGGGIKVGSTFGEVYAVQGVPSSARDDIWTYGKSRIRFSEGKVISWEEHLDDPLRIDRQMPHLIHAGFFGVGATKQEVRAIQGPPAIETDRVWHYGPSKVYFERDRVIRWEESPVQPLRAAR